jgi:hypothetical protein
MRIGELPTVFIDGDGVSIDVEEEAGHPAGTLRQRASFLPLMRANGFQACGGATPDRWLLGLKGADRLSGGRGRDYPPLAILESDRRKNPGLVGSRINVDAVVSELHVIPTHAVTVDHDGLVVHFTVKKFIADPQQIFTFLASQLHSRTNASVAEIIGAGSCVAW